MSDEDLKEKIRREQKRRRNAERRTKYQENRINSEEMKAFEDEDHRDFMYMFKRVEKGSLNDDMKIVYRKKKRWPKKIKKEIDGNQSIVFNIF